jgi:two-component system, NtrC family, sensor kinase
MFGSVVEQCTTGILIQREERLLYANRAALDCLGLSSIADLASGALAELFEAESYATLCPNLRKVVPDDDQLFMGELKLRRSGGGLIDAEVQHAGIPSSGDGTSVLNFRDVTIVKRIEAELHQSQKLESVGRLAAGIAHEINTPIQFIGDSAHFVGTMLTEVLGLVRRSRAELRGIAAAGGDAAALQRFADEEEVADFDHAMEHGPRAVGRILDGVSRVSRIVSAMRCFSHPGSAEACAVDVNKLLADTLVVAGHELKAVAEVATEFGPVPSLSGFASELNQAFLNLVVNAAHAVADRTSEAPGLGRVFISTRLEAGQIVIRITDTGCGMTPEVQARLFEPFFTTKAVGRGTGQGLAVVRAAIVQKHKGTVDCESVPGVGTTFIVRLPAEVSVP